jgi:hypothetical protein
MAKKEKYCTHVLKQAHYIMFLPVFVCVYRTLLRVVMAPGSVREGETRGSCGKRELEILLALKKPSGSLPARRKTQDEACFMQQEQI